MDYYSEQDAKEYNNFRLKMAQKISELRDEFNKMSPQNKMRLEQEAFGEILLLTAYKRS